MRKVFALAPKEDWIVDRFVKEFNADNHDIAVTNPKQADVIWLFADWCFAQVPTSLLATKKVITTIHHVVPDKFGPAQLQEFKLRDQFTSAYHVPNVHTEAFIKPLTQRPIHVIPYWANQHIWKRTGAKDDLRKIYALPADGYLIGSFQRDTEGAGISKGVFLPKLEKGPDLLFDAITHARKTMSNVHVVLAGWRRQYLIQQLESAGIPYTYFDLPSQETINELYQTLDLYPITARYEGGPQSLIECGLLGVPVVSRDVGMASQLLPSHAIADDVTHAVPAIPNIEHLKLPQGYQAYRRLFEEV